MMRPCPELALLHRDIDARVEAIRSHHPDWPCGKGCGHCCQQLADVPQLRAAEWQWLAQGLAALPAAQRQALDRRLTALPARPAAPVVCPLLDPASDACLVYAHRPVACRSYGFYVERERGLYCQTLETQVAQGTRDAVIWGNHAALDRRLTALGEARALTVWWAEQPPD